ncbi:MAG: alpha/beta hydrolase [Pseudomonadota bacterium]
MSRAPHPTDLEPVSLDEHRWFYVGGQRVQHNGEHYVDGAAYVECYVPEVVRSRWPMVLVHGGVQTGTNFVATPDGRRGWLHDFLRAGFPVYILEQPERGRSGHALTHGGNGDTRTLVRYSQERIVERFTASSTRALWPQAVDHTQWPGSGLPGDHVFDNFFASQVEMLADRTEIEILARDAGCALLDQIGPAVLLTHSQSGPFGWLIADQRPSLVKALLSIEPNGPPFYEVEFSGGTDWYRYSSELARPYGITRAPLNYADLPAGETPEHGRCGDRPETPGLVPGFQQAAPPRKLPNLAGVPILIATAEASYHATYDHLTSRFLHEADVAHTFMRLADHGLTGNGHMVMLEQNSHEVADLLIRWLDAEVDGLWKD